MDNRNYHKYFALSREDLSWGIHVLNCGSIFLPSGMKSYATDHPEKYRFSWQKGRILHEFQLIYIVKGRGVFESDHCPRTTIESGMVLLLFPGDWHRYKAEPETDWNTYWIGFDGDQIQEIIPKIKITRAAPILQIGYHETLMEIFNEIIEVSKNEFSGYQQVLAGEVMRLLGWVHAIAKKSEFKEEQIETLMHDAKLMLIQPREYRDLEKIARALNMGYSKFRKLFKNYTGLSPGQYKMQHQINKAINLLQDNKYSIQEICDLLGFESTQYFSRIFKQKTGKTPGSYRNS